MGTGKHHEHSAHLWLWSYNRPQDLTGPVLSQGIDPPSERFLIPAPLRPVPTRTLVANKPLAAQTPVSKGSPDPPLCKKLLTTSMGSLFGR